jgi:hypothetical protein
VRHTRLDSNPVNPLVRDQKLPSWSVDIEPGEHALTKATASCDGEPRTMTRSMPDRWQIIGLGNTDPILRSSLGKTRTQTGWTAREFRPIFLSGIAAMDGPDGFWARSISQEAHQSARDAGPVPVIYGSAAIPPKSHLRPGLQHRSSVDVSAGGGQPGECPP